MPVHGVDISHHQPGNLDLAGAKRRGLKWLYHKATEGDMYEDPNYARRRAEARAAGLPFGAYHFARAESKADGTAEARRFITYARPTAGDLRPALDLETTEGLSMAALREFAEAFIAEVERLVGVKPIVYTPYDLGVSAKGCLIWRPRYNNSNTPPVLPYDVWQFSNGVFGVPSSLEGIGHVDLNTMRPGLTVEQMLIPKRKPDPLPTQRLHMTHVSMQFSDNDAEHIADCNKVFARAAKRGVAWITGTEAGGGSGNLSQALVAAAKANGYRIWVPSAKRRPAAEGGTTDCWIAVRRDFIKGNWEQGFIPAIPGSRSLYEAQGLDGDKTFPRWGTKGLVWVSFDSVLGRINIGAGHYLTQARHPKAVVKGVDHWEWNKKFAGIISDWAVEQGAGEALVFYGGDQNMADSLNDQPQGDTFFGGPLTSAADELKRWENTGHGPIDVIASHDADGRVEAAYWRVLDDSEFALATDHFMCEAGYDVRLLKQA
jgi:GH25 family lysozyme M1 (1,4-beta-N-acetylmuramidase)